MAFDAGVKRLGTPMGTLFLNMVPVSVIAVRAMLGEAPHASEIAGAALVGIGLALTVWTPRVAAVASARAGHRALNPLRLTALSYRRPRLAGPCRCLTTFHPGPGPCSRWPPC